METDKKIKELEIIRYKTSMYNTLRRYKTAVRRHGQQMIYRLDVKAFDYLLDVYTDTGEGDTFLYLFNERTEKFYLIVDKTINKARREKL